MTLNVLVVEDYPDLRAAIAGVLSRNDYVCDCVGTDEAIDKLRANRYERILLSTRMPIGDDPVMHFLLENQPAELEHLVLMKNPGTDDVDEPWKHVLNKPFSLDELLAKIR